MYQYAPGWVMRGAKYDFDFANGRYWGAFCGLHNNTNNYQDSVVTCGLSGFTQYYPKIDSTGNALAQYGTVTNPITPGYGLWVFGGSTNYTLQNRDFSNASWTKTNITATKNQTGADGSTNGASSLTATAANGTVLQGATVASTTFTTSAYIKRLVGSGSIFMTCDNGTTWVDITSQIGTTYSSCAIPTQTLANPTFGFKIATSGDSIAVDMFQCENYAYQTAPMATTASTATRGNQEPCFNTVISRPNAGLPMIHNIFDANRPWSAMMWARGNAVSTAWIIASDGPVFMFGGCDGGTFNGQQSTTTETGNYGMANLNKVITTVTGAGSKACINGGNISALGSDVTYSYPRALSAITHCGLGNNGAGTAPINGAIARITLWDKEITDIEMREFTR